MADYLIVNTMHVLAVNSVSTLLNYLSEQLQNTPSLADIQGWNKELIEEGEEGGKEKEENSKVRRVYRSQTRERPKAYSWDIAITR